VFPPIAARKLRKASREKSRRLLATHSLESAYSGSESDPSQKNKLLIVTILPYLQMESERAELESRVEAFIRRESSEPFETLALAIHNFQYRANIPYRRFVEESGGSALADWRDIPAVPQDAFKHATLTTFPVSECTATFRTSGTTGRGRGEHHFCGTALYDLSIIGAWRELNIPEIRRVSLIPPPEIAPHSSLSHMMGVLGALDESQEFCVDSAGAPDYAKLHDIVGTYQEPLMLLGTALTFHSLLEEGENQSLHLPTGSYLWETGGYKALRVELSPGQLYSKLSCIFEVPQERIINEYGMTELSSQFYRIGPGTPHRAARWLRARVIDPETGRDAGEGEIGFLRLYDLANVGSVLAVETQDLAIRKGENFVLTGRDPSALPRGCSLDSEAIIAASRAESQP
jgi:hypothetical protein